MFSPDILQSFPLCPYCFNNPPFPDMRKQFGCNQCTHPTCQHALIQHGVCECVECETGILVLDPTSYPKWRMACNKQVSLTQLVLKLLTVFKASWYRLLTLKAFLFINRYLPFLLQYWKLSIKGNVFKVKCLCQLSLNTLNILST